MPPLPPGWLAQVEASACHPDFVWNGDLIVVLVSSQYPSPCYHVHPHMLALSERLQEAEVARDQYGEALFTEEDDEIWVLDCAPKEIETALRSVYWPEPTTHLTFPAYHADHALVVRQYIDLARRHHLHALFETCRREGQRLWPKDLTEWDEEEDRIRRAAEGHLLRQDARPLDQSLPEPASALMLALNCRLPAIVPALLATLARIPRHRVWEHQGTTQHSPAMSDPAYRGARWDVLIDLRRLLSPITEHTPGCNGRAACADARAALLLELDQLETAAAAFSATPTPFRQGAPVPMDPEPYHDAFTVLNLINPAQLAALGFSEPCRAHVFRWALTRRDDLWHALARLAASIQ